MENVIHSRAAERGASQNEVPPPRVAVAGHLFGRRRTVFAAVPVKSVRPNPLQPRQFFDEESLADLARSIHSRGVLQPIIVRRGPGDEFTLIAGERRLRASEMAGMALVPAILRDDDLLEVALEENVQREDLTPLEEAEALAILAQDRGLSHAELAQVIHKSRPYVSNTLALTRLPEDVKREYFRDSRGVSREILINIARQGSADEMRATWRKVRLQSMSVRSFRESAAGGSTRAPSPVADAAIRAARRLGRELRALPGPGRLPPDEIAALRRTLTRAQRRITTTLGALESGWGVDALPPTNSPPRRSRAAGAGARG